MNHAKLQADQALTATPVPVGPAVRRMPCVEPGVGNRWRLRGLHSPGICGGFSCTLWALRLRMLMLSISTPNEKAIAKYT